MLFIRVFGVLPWRRVRKGLVAFEDVGGKSINPSSHPSTPSSAAQDGQDRTVAPSSPRRVVTWGGWV